MPRSDLCQTCQQNTVETGALANMDDTKYLEHLNLAQRERLYYTDTIQKCTDKTFNATHISSDFAQQLHIPRLSYQPGPVYFLTPYKIRLFGVHNEAVCLHVNYVDMFQTVF